MSQGLRRGVSALKESLPCTDCGEFVHHAAMQFDHLPGSDKRGEVAVLQRHSSRRLVLEEIAKCEPVCANCHAMVEAGLLSVPAECRSG